MTVCAACGAENPEGAKFCNACATALETAPAQREQRKTVTVLFCDVTGSTALGESTDPEALRALLARYFERMKGIVEAHGGTVEKFIGDAVMAVFGVPRVHEDDALRAVRAALEMREALPELGVQARIGVNTGEVVTGTEERLATGDAVNVAARLERAAQPGEVLLGETTLQLVRDVVETEPVEPLELKGKAEPVPAHRLVEVTSEPLRRHESPLVGRERERRLLADAWERVQSEGSCFLFTLLGPAGVGKSRLAAEFLAGIDARVVRGRCLSYGEGITYWALVEALIQLGKRPADETAAAAIGSVLGETNDPTTPDEIAWAARKTLEEAAAEQPLVCVFDDAHWGEPAFLDLIEHVADFSRDAPILLLCIARPELLERREGWGGGKMNATTVLLEPLSAAETDELIEQLGHLDEGLKERIRDAAEGNPLFVEEMLAMVREAGDGEVAVPPTIQALLAARLDQLDAPERAVLERGAVEGKVFHRGAVQALAPEEPQVPQRLMALVRKELVRPDKAMLPGDDAFRFRHLLIRDAAYDALPKAERAELHERFAAWLEEHGAELVELDEILGYHLEQAFCYRAELALPEDPDLRDAARGRLIAAGQRALLRRDLAAALNLFERAASLVPQHEIDLGLELDLIDTLFHAGRMHDASDRAGSLAERASAAGQRVPELCGQLWVAMVRLYVEPEGAAETLEALTAEAIPLFEASGDDRALYLGHFATGWVAHMRAQMDTERDALEEAMSHVRRLELPHLEVRMLPGMGASRIFGTTPVPDLVAWLDEQEQSGLRHPSLRAHRAEALATLGRFDEARSMSEEIRAEMAERGAKIPVALMLGHSGVDLELLAGDPAAAVELGEEGCAMFEELGERSWLSTAAGKLAEAYYRLDRLEEAESWAERARDLGASDDAVTQMLWRQVAGKVLARRERYDEAERLLREAIAIGEPTDGIEHLGNAYLDLAEVLSSAGQDDEAVGALEQALALFERKGSVVMAEQTRRRLESLR